MFSLHELRETTLRYNYLAGTKIWKSIQINNKYRAIANQAVIYPETEQNRFQIFWSMFWLVITNLFLNQVLFVFLGGGGGHKIRQVSIDRR